MQNPEESKRFFAEVSEIIGERKERAESEAKDKCKNGRASMATGISALFAAWLFFQDRPQSSPSSSKVASPTNLEVCNHICWLCNTAIAIRRLACTGLEPQAKILARSFLESIYQILVIFHDNQARLKYEQGINSTLSKEVYYEVFAKKKSLHKKLQRLEDSFVKYSPDERDTQYQQKIEMLEHYSQATHSSSIHVLTSALQPTDGDLFKSTILGSYTLSTERTLLNCSHEIVYFCMLLEHIMKKIWLLDELENDKNYQNFSFLFKLTAKFRVHKLSSSASENSPKQ